MDEEEKRPLKHLKFNGFEAVDGDSTVDEIRRIFTRQAAEIAQELEYNRSELEYFKSEKAERQQDLDGQKKDLCNDPQIFYIRMRKRHDQEITDLQSKFPDKNDPQYIEKVAAIEANYAVSLDKDLLDKNQDGYFNKVMDSIEASTKNIRKEVSDKEKEVGTTNASLTQNAVSVIEQRKALEKDPETYTQLYNIKRRSATAVDSKDDPKTEIMIDKKGKPYLAVIMREAHFPGGFIISDGKINFTQGNIDKMTLENMRHIIDYLERRGIKGIELPADVDEKLKELYNEGRVANQAEEDANWNAHENEDNQPADNMPVPLEGHADGQSSAAGHTNTSPENLSESFGGNHQETILAGQTGDYNKLTANIEDWVFGAGGMNKQEFWTGFRSFKYDGGWDCWTVYDQGNFRNDELDGKVDKDGNIKTKYAFKIYSRKIKDENGNDRLELKYAMPGGKKISDGYANGIMRMLKKSGQTHVNFPQGLPEEDEGTFRISCAGSGLVPMLDNLNENKVNKMLDEAKNKLSAKDLLEYKNKLAMWMEKCIIKEGAVFEDHKNASLITNLKGEYQAQPFRDMYEKGGGIRSKLMDIVKDNEDNDGTGIDKQTGQKVKYSGAVKIAAAADSVAMLFEVYISNHDKPVSEMLNDPRLSTAPFDKNEIINGMMAGLQRLDPPMDFPANKKVRDLKPREMAAFYEALIPGNERKYAKEFDNEIIKASQQAAAAGQTPIKDNAITKLIMDKARNHFSSVSANLEEDYNVKKIYLPNLGLPQHDFIGNRERLIAEGAMKRPKPRKPRGRGRPGFDDDYDDDDEFEM